MKRSIEAAALACLLSLVASSARAQELDPGDQPPPPPGDQPAPPPPGEPGPPPQPMGAAPAPAPVEPEADEAPWARTQTNRVGLEFDVWPAQRSFFGTDVSIFALGLTPVAQLRVVENVYVVVEIPLGLGLASIDAPEGVTVDDDSAGTFTIGNPTLGAYYGTVLERQFAIFAGMTLSVPTIFDPGDDRAVAVAFVSLTHAFQDEHRWAPEYLPIRPFGGVEIKIIPNLYYKGDLAPVFYVPLDGQDVEFFMDQGNEIEYRADMGLGAGFRFQEAFLWTAPDKIQTAAELFGTYESPEPGFFARLGFLLALDETGAGAGGIPIGGGFGFDEGKLAEVRGSLGGKW